jgi:hypothetical protein
MNFDFSFLQQTTFTPLDAPLSQDEIILFETLNSIVIPEEYKLFLMTIGNGIKIDIDKKDCRYVYGIKRPILKRHNRRLKMDFFFEEPYHQRLSTHDFQLPLDCIDPEGELEGSCIKCRHLDHCFYAFDEKLDDYDHMMYNGAYPICYAGCTYMYFLILNGIHKGEVWINNETSDFAPSKKSFADFLHFIITSKVY